MRARAAGRGVAAALAAGWLCAGAAVCAEQVVAIGPLELHARQSQETVEQVIDRASCGHAGSAPLQLNVKRKKRLELDMNESLMREFSAALGLGVDLKYAELSGSVRSEVTKAFGSRVSTEWEMESSRSLSVAPDPCYRKEILRIQRVQKYEVDVYKVGMVWGRSAIAQNLTFDEPFSEFELKERWIYSPECASCQAQIDAPPAVNRNGDAVQIQVDSGPKWLELPLYWDGEHVLFDRRHVRVP